MKSILKKIFIKEDGSPDTFMIVICAALIVSLLFACIHEILLWISVLQNNHLSEAELKYMYDISFLYSITIISELITGGGYQISKKIFSKNEGGNG